MSMQPATPRPVMTCPACQGMLRSIGRLPVRSDTAKQGVLTFAQPGENVPAVGIDAYRCHDCGRLELYDHDFLLPSF